MVPVGLAHHFPALQHGGGLGLVAAGKGQQRAFVGIEQVADAPQIAEFSAQ